MSYHLHEMLPRRDPQDAVLGSELHRVTTSFWSTITHRPHGATGVDTATPKSARRSSCDVDVDLPPASASPVPMFALIIGINGYQTHTSLRGAVADAKAFKNYLQEVIHVSEDHIRTLFDCEATRNGIIQAFEELRDNRLIRHGDPIVIYFAGHGGELDPPPAWGVKKKIQCLLPHDYRPNDIHPIPDHTVGSLIEGIAKLKGDNITVIFDCCHSASGTRDEEYIPRSVLLDHTIPANLDDHIWGDRVGSIPQSSIYHGLQSHILLAACGEQEIAYEHDGHGQFTTALLTILKQTDISSLTYIDIIRRISLPKQNPHCEGVHQDRVLFNARGSASKRAHSVRSTSSIRGCTYVISAGLVHGVSHGAEFTVYGDRKQRVDVIVADDTADIEDFQTTLTTSISLASDSFAKLTRVGNLPFYLEPGMAHHPLEETLRTRSANFRLAHAAEEAKLEVSRDGDVAIFRALDWRVNAFGLTTLPHKVTSDKLGDILSAAARYFWYLDLTNKNIPLSTTCEISIDFFLLEIDYDDDGNDMYVPVQPGLCQKGLNFGEDVVDFVVTPNAVYGIKLTNNTPWDLFFNAFLFNNSSLSIKSCYTHAQSSSEGPAAPLQHNETLTIGYGPGGSPPFRYSLENNQDIDVSFFKGFFATRPIDLSMIEQTTPFAETKERDLIEDDARKARLSVSEPMQESGEPADFWFTIEIPVVQRRG